MSFLGDNGFYMAVVEDRNDPKMMGRVRVRVMGVHSPDRKNDIPIDSLPWSVVMHSPSESSTSGKISQLVEGTWVIVMYVDENMQDPIVFGSLPSYMGPQRPDYEQGFSDPFGVYPRFTNGESDTSLIGKPDEWKQHPTYNTRERTKIKEIPVAKVYPSDTVSERDTNGGIYNRETWDELPPRSQGCSQYPYNDVKEYEGGIVQEYDSSPGSTRIATMHPSGTYDEVLVDGSKTTKIIGDGYEIVMGNNQMYIKGNLDITVEGNMRHLVKGDYTLEVGGNYYQYVNKNKSSKVALNDTLEVGENQSSNIAKSQSTRVGADQTNILMSDRLTEVASNDFESIGGNKTYTVAGYQSQMVSNENYLMVGKNNTLSVGGINKSESVGNTVVDSDVNIIISAQIDVDMDAGFNVDIDAQRIDLN